MVKKESELRWWEFGDGSAANDVVTTYEQGASMDPNPTISLQREELGTCRQQRICVFLYYFFSFCETESVIIDIPNVADWHCFKLCIKWSKL